MQINLPIILIVLFAICVLIVFMIRRNRKDRKQLERKLNEDYRRPSEHDAKNDEAGSD